jgi:aromatic-ring opening dioxygenase LigAB LigA subunit
MRDYWLSKLFFDLQNPAAAAEYRADRAGVLARYLLKPEVRAAVERDDVTYVAKLVNPYLLRFYFHMSGMPEEEFLRRIRASRPTVEIPTIHNTATGGTGGTGRPR